MADSLKTVSVKSGLPPGSLIHVGDVLESETSISVIDYSKEVLDEQDIQSIDELLRYKDSDTVTWVIIEGLANVDIVDGIGKMFGIHQLVLEDILNTHQRAKFEEHDDYLYIVLKCLFSEDERFAVDNEQISLLVLKNFVFTFKEKRDDFLLPVQQRIRTSAGRFRRLGSDYLTYAILDQIVDQNFILIDSLDEAISSIEDNLMAVEPGKNILNAIHKLKRQVITIRKHTSPVRELVAGMLRSESELIDEKTYIYLRDVYDHAIRVTESIESYREILTGLLEIYASGLSNKMNEVMKVLTMFASIFIPLTFLAGVYGMNFDNMPELGWEWAYPALWGVFLTVTIVLLIYFKKRKWL